MPSSPSICVSFCVSWSPVRKREVKSRMCPPYPHRVVTSDPPCGPGGFKSRMCPPYPQRDRKRRLNGAVCRNHRIERVVPCRCWVGHVKEPYEMSMALGARP